MAAKLVQVGTVCITLATWYVLALTLGVFLGSPWAIARGEEIVHWLARMLGV